MMAATDGEILMKSRSVNFDRPGQRLGGEVIGDVWKGGMFGRERSAGTGFFMLSFSTIHFQKFKMMNV